jgi:hypothetical protein
MELLAFIAMGALLIYQGIMNYLQHKQIQTLLDKFMSRDYTQYATNKSYIDNYNNLEVIDKLEKIEDQYEHIT